MVYRFLCFLVSLCIALHSKTWKDETNPILFFFVLPFPAVSSSKRRSVLLSKLRSSRDSTKRANQIDGIVACVLHCIALLASRLTLQLEEICVYKTSIGQFDVPEADRPRLVLIHFSDRSSTRCAMEMKTKNVSGAQTLDPSQADQGLKVEYYHRIQRQGNAIEYRRTLSHGRGSGRRLLPTTYFSLESLLLLVCLTATLLILPLIVPPLPPPPFMLLLLPIGILGVLMILAFMPSNVRDLTYTYV